MTATISTLNINLRDYDKDDEEPKEIIGSCHSESYAVNQYISTNPYSITLKLFTMSSTTIGLRLRNLQYASYSNSNALVSVIFYLASSSGLGEKLFFHDTNLDVPALKDLRISSGGSTHSMIPLKAFSIYQNRINKNNFLNLPDCWLLFTPPAGTWYLKVCITNQGGDGQDAVFRCMVDRYDRTLTRGT